MLGSITQKILLKMLGKALICLFLVTCCLSTSQIICPPYYTYTELGCVEVCASPTFDNCGNVFPALWNPSFCALDQWGNWKSFTYACQACKSGYLAVKDGKCGCEVEGCSQGYKCQNGKCVLTQPTCPLNYIDSALGCIQSCSSPTYADCPNFYPLIYNPSFCGLNADGSWRSFTFACQACKAGFIAVAEGKCSCELEPCQPGYKCVNNQCVADSPCGVYEINTPHGCILSCDTPELRTCPDVITTLIYDPQYCGLRTSGQWISYTHICQACSSGGIGVKEGKCTCEQLGCRSDQICDRGYCEDVKPGECRNSYECPEGFFCSSNKCVDKCIVTLCVRGSRCQKGQCIADSECPCSLGQQCVNDKCVAVNACDKCQDYEFCVNGNECVDKCLATTCLKGYICVKGQCIPKNQCSFNSECKSYEFCLNGRCTDKCAYIKCSSGYVCQFGGCIPKNECQHSNDCPSNFICRSGQCIDQCAGVNCAPGYTCKEGNCVSTDICSPACTYGKVCRSGNCIDPCIFTTCPSGQVCREGSCLDACALIKCAAGFECINGKCVKTSDICLSNDDCQKGEYCFLGICADKCSVIDCQKGFTCKFGQCIPDLDYCPATDTGNVQYCTEPRPDDATCSPIYYFRAPDPAYCGVLANGTRRNFPRQCETCKDKDIVYYFDVPCHEAPFVCQEGETCRLDYYCGSQQCSSASDCPYDWQNCFQNKCIDRCELLRCAQCKFGQCGYQEPYGKCLNDGDCTNGWECIGLKCVDSCSKIRCPPGFSCWRGGCERD